MGEQNNAKKQEQSIGGIDPNAFDAQMLLLDAYLGYFEKTTNKIKIQTGPKVGSTRQGGSLGRGITRGDRAGRKNVPYGRSIQSINSIMSTVAGGKHVDKFILQPTPNELAQMYVKIQLFLVDSLTGNEIEIPLTTGADIRSGATLANNSYYTTRQIGLKSLSMRLDGRDHAFYAKSYLTNIELVFDSINTFLEPIGNVLSTEGNDKTPKQKLLNLTFAQAFRSTGRTVTQPFYTKLVIGYDSANSTIKEKYGFDSPDMKFILFLSLIKTSIKIDENLKTTINVEYQSREENLFNSTLAFDFLGLDLEEAQKRLETAFASAGAVKAEIDSAREAYVAAAVEETKNKHRDTIKKVKELREVIANAGDTALDTISYNNEKYEFEDAEEYNKFAAEILKMEQSLNDNALRKQFTKQYNDQYRGTDRVKEQDDIIANAQRYLANIRHNEINKAIAETFKFDQASTRKKKIIKTIFLSSADLKRYYDQDDRKTPKTQENVEKNLNENREQVAADAKQKDTEDVTENFDDAESTVTTKVTPKNNAGQQEDINQFQLSIDQFLIKLGNEKQIDYILFGDLLRLLYRRLYKIKRTQLQKLKRSQALRQDPDRILKAIKQSSILFSNITFESFEKKNKRGTGTLVTKNVYDIPISVSYIKYLLAKKLYGKQSTTYTVMEMINDIFDLLSLTRKRKAQVLNSQATIGNFSLKSLTYPMIIENREFRICTDPNATEKKVRSGMVIFVKRVADNKPINDKNVPEFIFGGVDRGIIKKFEVKEIADDDTQKLVMEQLRGTIDQIIPSFFEVSISTVLAPFFQLGMFIKVRAPTINTQPRVYANSGATSQGAAASNLFLEGDYQVHGVTHNFTAGGTWTSNIKAILFNSDRKKYAESMVSLSARQAREEQRKETEALLTVYKDAQNNGTTGARLNPTEDQIKQDAVGAVNVNTKLLEEYKTEERIERKVVGKGGSYTPATVREEEER